MVQIDVFWSYGFGATYAIAASARLRRDWLADPVAADEGQFRTQSFVRCLAYLAMVFAPSGAYLLWAFPDWETMMVAESHASLPAWLVTGFAVTNVTQGILGYWLTRRHIVRGQYLAAFMHLAVSNFLFWFVLLHGWDGTGYQRFLSETRADFLAWESYDPINFIGSGPMLALVGLGVFVVPVLFWHWSSLFREGAILTGLTQDGTTPSAPEHRWVPLKLMNGYFGSVFICGIASAAVAGVLVQQLGWLAGLAVFALAFAVLGLSSRGFCRVYARHLMWH